ncbi:MAG: hypothetical protein V1821_03365 [bacterium]
MKDVVIGGVKYPYLPEGREFKFVPLTHPMMQEAIKAQKELAGDPLWPIGTVLTRDNRVLARAGNGFNRGSQGKHICPRIVQECKSGEGYDLCALHAPEGHAERMIREEARRLGIPTEGADLYFFGHWWFCEPCWQEVIAAGIRDTILPEGADRLFSKEVVYAETLRTVTTLRSAYISGALTNLPEAEKTPQKKFYEDLAAACGELGIKAYVPHLFTDPDKHKGMGSGAVHDMDVREVLARDVLIAEVTYPSLGTGGELVEAEKAGRPIVLLSRSDAQVSRFALGNSAVVYHVKYQNTALACRWLKNVLKQL